MITYFQLLLIVLKFNTNTFKCSGLQIFAIPKVDKKNKRKPSARRGKTVIHTDSPYKNELMEDMKKQDTVCLKLLWENENYSQKVSKKKKTKAKAKENHDF